MTNILTISGLYTSANQLSEVPPGALSAAENVDILYKGVVQIRRGFEKATSLTYSDTADRTDKITFFNNYLLAHHGTAYAADTLSYYNSGFTSVGTFTAPTDRKMQFIQANKNLYFTTNAGMKKMEAYNSTPASSGVPKALNLTLALYNGSNNWLANNDMVAYRMIWCKTDANNNLLVGSPSGRAFITNTSGATRSIEFEFQIPDDITTSHFYQIYRSAATTSPTTPSDEMQLVYEGYPTSAQITAGAVTIATDNIIDITPDGLRGVALYTNASQEGLSFQNEQPPLCKDLATYGDCVFYANTTDKHRYNITLISAATLVNNDTITIGGVTYTAKTAGETVASGFFKLFTSGTVAQNIEDTAISLVNVINGYSSSTVYAYYMSSVDDLPGKILLEERGFGGAAFAIATSKPLAWTPAGIPTSGTTETSDNDSQINKLTWSKPFQPEHVPLPNSVLVGSANFAIKKIIGLKDYLIIFKEDGIFKLTGSYPYFTVELLDSSAILAATESVQILNNEIFALTDIGVVKISEGVELISTQINQDVTKIINEVGTNLEVTAFGVPYEVEKKYYLWLPRLTSDSSAVFAYVYNLQTNAWTTHEVEATTGAIGSKTLYLGSPDTSFIIKERKNYTFLDYVDYGFDTSITNVNGKVLTIATNIDSIEAGDAIWQSNTIFSIVQSVDNINSTVTVDREPGFTVATCEVLKSIDTKIAWSVYYAPDVSVSKQFNSAIVHFDKAFSGDAYLGFSTDFNLAESQVTLSGTASNAWGTQNWGSGNWGTVDISRSFRNWIPRQHQRGSRLNVFFRQSYAYSQFALTGITLIENAGNQRVRRS